MISPQTENIVGAKIRKSNLIYLPNSIMKTILNSNKLIKLLCNDLPNSVTLDFIFLTDNTITLAPETCHRAS